MQALQQCTQEHLLLNNKPSSKSSSSVWRGKGKQLVTSRHFLLVSTNPSNTPWTSSLPPAPSSWQCLMIFKTTCEQYATIQLNETTAMIEMKGCELVNLKPCYINYALKSRSLHLKPWKIKIISDQNKLPVRQCRKKSNLTVIQDWE